MIISGTEVSIVQGNILEQPVDAIVNAANPSLEGGGGVDGMIHSAAGGELVQACREYKKKRGISQINVGEAIVTESYAIKSTNPHILYVIHTVGPNCRVLAQDRDKKNLLKKAYQNSLEKAREIGIRSVAFPAISTGIYGYPFEEAQRVAIRAIVEYLESSPGCFREIRLIYYSESDFNLAKDFLL